MKLNFSKLLTVAIAATLLGCATAGNDRVKDQTQDTVAQKLISGKTTKADVKEQFGEPSSISFTDSGNEIWTYKFSRATPKGVNFVPIVNLFVRGADVSTKTIVVLFDANGKVSKFTMTEDQSEVKGGLAQ